MSSDFAKFSLGRQGVPGKSHWSILRPGTSFVTKLGGSNVLIIDCVLEVLGETQPWLPSVTHHSHSLVWTSFPLTGTDKTKACVCLLPTPFRRQRAGQQPCLAATAQHWSGQRHPCLFSQFPLWMEDPTSRVLPPPQADFLGVLPRDVAFSHTGRVKHSLPSRMRADAL